MHKTTVLWWWQTTLDVRAYVDRYQSNPAKGVNDLRDQLQAAMETVFIPQNSARGKQALH